ncbi:CMRF35-like molecule 8 [Clupea harengus]|uniref:CMRF35-like molecule 8 n=1 Tax=Clupea harengus TaxID=7950 RepID=A0A6P8F1V4_CLUHA|nr:CMRF35-like molecule 8 [Clupea harengus]
MLIWIKDKWVNSPYKDKKRFSLYDNTTGGVFIVSITNLTKEDAGIYWCGVHVSFQKNSPLSVDKITEVILNVKNADQSGNPPPGHLPLIPLALVLSLAVGVLVLGMALFFCRRFGKKITKAPTSPDIPIYTNTAENTQGTGDYVNAGVQEPQANTPTGPMRSNRPYSDPDYQNSNMSDTTTYQTLIASTRQNDSIYHTLHPRTNQQ